MPMYEFNCKECGQEFEELRNIDDYNTKCPLCNSSNINKKMSVSQVKTSSTQTVDHIIGADSEMRWAAIEEKHSQRTKEYFGNVPVDDIKVKDQRRLNTVLNRQNTAFNVINKAKKEVGITKKDEMNHLLKG